MQHDGELKYFKDMACHIKKQIEEQEKGTSGWHVVVGKSNIFSSHITYSRHKLWQFCYF